MILNQANHLKTKALPKDLYSIIEHAFEDSSLAQTGLIQCWICNQAIHLEHQILLGTNALYTSQYDMDLKTLHQHVLNRLEHDLYTTQLLDLSVQSHIALNDVSTNYPLHTNKMEIILNGAKDLLSEYKNFEAIAQGHFPEGFAQAPHFPVMTGDLDAVYGNSNASYLSAALIEVAATLQNAQSVSDVYQFFDHSVIDYSSIVHVIPISEPCLENNEDLLLAYEDYTFRLQDEITPFGLSYVHSGYAFGGHRDEARYPDGKFLGPEDCSSWIAKLSGCENLFSTIDQLFTYRVLTENGGYVDSDWLKSDVAHEMLSIYSPVLIEDPWHDIQAGQIMAFRRFEHDDHLQDPGYSGHTALVLGLNEDEQLVTLNYNRNMPEKEGFGIALFDWKSDNFKDVMFFEVTDQSPTIKLEDVIDNSDILTQSSSHEHHFPELGLMPSMSMPLLPYSDLDPSLITEY